MENKIRLLPEIVANQIAAGEVVDNPSSAIKEMMENAIDAGATSVTVNFRNAGLDLIQIIDDGCGMSPMDARMAFDRHATSKIRDFDDVYRLQTFGFRGEALASIAAVAQVELRTRRSEDEVGTVTIVNGGEFVSQSPIMCPVGSQFLVRNLFYTAPARRKFNGDRNKMVSAIKKVFRCVAMCNPQVRCELMSSDMPIISLPAGSLMERIIGVVGRHVKSNLLEVNVDTSIVKVKGYVGRPAAAKQKNTEQYLFVNGRYFRSPQIYRSILGAYNKLIPDNESPSYFLYLTVEPDRVDVNVSPHKTEVRFADHDDVNQIIQAAVRSTLAKSGSVAMMDFDNSVAVEIPVLGEPHTIYAEPRSASNDNYNPFREDYIDGSLSEMQQSRDVFADIAQAEPLQHRPHVLPRVDDGLQDVLWGANSDFSFEIDTTTSVDVEAAESYRDIASSAFGGEHLGDDSEGDSSLIFIPSAVQQSLVEAQMSFSNVMLISGDCAVATSAGRVMIVDLRRAKERILYDSYVATIGVATTTQKLLFPEMLTLSLDDYSLLAEHEVEFAALGFDLHLADDCNVELRGIPPSLEGANADTLLYELLRVVEANCSIGEHLRENMAQLLAQKGSRVAMSDNSQAAELLQRLCSCENFSFTPSGKAIMAEIPFAELKAYLG